MDAFAATDIEGKLLFISENTRKLFGFRNSTDIMGMSVFSLVAENEFEKAKSNFLKRKEGVETGYVEYTGIRADGISFPLEINGKKVVGESGDTEYIFYIFRDITQQKKISEELFSEREQFQQVIGQLDEIVYKVDTKGRILYVSDSVKVHSGYSPEEIIGKIFFEFVYEGDLPLVIETFSKIDDLLVKPITYRYRIKSGGFIWVRTKTVPFYENGVLAGGYGTLVNITELMNKEKSLEESEKKLNLAQLISKSGSFEIDFKTDTAKWSENNFRIFGFEPYSVTPSGDLFLSMVYPDDIPIVESFTNRFRMSDTLANEEYEFRIIRKDGKLRWVHSFIECVREDNELRYLRGTNTDIHERKIAELKQISHNQRYNAILGATPDLVLIYDKIGICVDYVSSPNSKKAYLPENKIIGSSLNDLFPENLVTEFIRHFAMAINTGKLVTKEYYLDYGDKRFYYEARITKLNSEQVLIFIRDISSQKIAENETLIFLKRQRLVADISQKINISQDITQDIKPILDTIRDYFTNSCVFLYFGNNSSDLFEKCYCSFDSGELECKKQINSIKSFLNDILNSNHNEPHVYNDIADINILVSVPLMAQNEKYAVFGLLVDAPVKVVSNDDLNLFKIIAHNLSSSIERFIILKKLENSTMLLNHFVEIAMEGHWDLNVDTGIMKYNRTGARMLGYDYEEIAERDMVFWNSIIHPEDYPSAEEKFKQCIIGEINNFELILRIRAKFGEWKWIMLRANVVKRNLKNNRAKRVMGIHVDITEQKKTEELLKNALSTRDKLFSIIAHDLRGPINNLIPLTDLFISRNKRGKIPECMIIDMKKSVIQTTELLDNLLNWTRLQTKNFKVNPVAFQVKQIIDEIMTIYHSSADFKKIKVNSEIPEDLVAFADQNSVKVIIRNLVNNSIKYTREGGEINITARDDGDYVLISVIDNGVGMSEEMINNFYDSKLFVSNYGTGNEKGTGLGLALCKESAESNGGSIDVYSREGEGTRFDLTLKRNPEKIFKPVKHTKNELKSLSGSRVLLADDDPVSQLYISNMLLKWGAKVTTAENGKVALDIIKEEEFDLIIMDVEMPVIDGFSAIRVIKYEMNLTVPIIALSSNLSDEKRQEAIDSGCIDYILKPGSPAEIFEKISECLNISKKSISLFRKSPQIKQPENFTDWQKLNESVGGDKEAINTIIGKFLEVSPNYFETLIDSFERKDYITLRAISHKFKSGISLIANKTAISNIENINSLASETENHLLLKPHIEKLKVWYPKLCEELKNRLRQSSRNLSKS